MKTRPDPSKPKATANLVNDPQVKAWTRRLGGGWDHVDELDEEQLLYVARLVMQERGEESEVVYHLERALTKTMPALAHPERTDLIEDLGHVFAQPEMEDFWATWTPREFNRRGQRARFPAVKALMATLGMGRLTSHLDDAYSSLASMPRLQELFADVDSRALVGAASRGHAVPSAQPFELPQRNALLKQLDRLGETCREPALKATIAMMKHLQRLLPEAGIGKRLLIDGCSVPAWAPQTGSGGNPDREAKLRRHCPEAGFRAHMYTSHGKVPLPPGTKLANGLRAGRAKFWRGYYYVVILDQATGLRLNSGLYDASQDEAAALIPLLSELFRYWPELADEVECIAGDGAWNEDWACRLAEVEYGMQPIFRLGQGKKKALDPGESQGGSIIAIEPDGRLICKHGKTLDYLTVDRPGRNGLAPGKPGPQGREGAFRMRGSGCPKCGTPGLRMKVDWSRLTTVPHHPHGRPDRYAYRQAMLMRLKNQVEGHFNRIKGGHHLGQPGAARTRVRDRATLEALFHLAELSMTALVLADQKQRSPIAKVVAASAPSTAAKPAGNATAAPASPAVVSTTPGGPAKQTAIVPADDPFAAVFGPGRGRE